MTGPATELVTKTLEEEVERLAKAGDYDGALEVLNVLYDFEGLERIDLEPALNGR
jgi:hypothetical protein